MARYREGLNVWPGFVDALATLLLVTVFVLVVVVLAQFPSQATSDISPMQSSDLQTLEARVLALQSALDDAPDPEQMAHLQQQLREAQARLERFARLLARYQQDLSASTSNLDQREASLQQLRQDNHALRQEMSGYRADLQMAATLIEYQDSEITTLRSEIQQLGSDQDTFRSGFLTQLYTSLADNPSIQVVGDRFLLPAEILFSSGSASLGPGGRNELAALAQELQAINVSLPEDLDWVLQVSGHTDSRPIRTATFPSNWALSSARALAIVEFLIEAGMPPERLAATGYGEFQPLNPAENPDAWRENRRIELKFTSR